MITTISTVQIILWGLVLAWLGACAACDLRSRQVPGWLTIPPLVLAAVGQLFQGNWQPVLLLVSTGADLRPAGIQMAHTPGRTGGCSGAFCFRIR